MTFYNLYEKEKEREVRLMNNYLKEMEKKNDFIIMMIKFGEEEFTWH